MRPKDTILQFENCRHFVHSVPTVSKKVNKSEKLVPMQIAVSSVCRNELIKGVTGVQVLFANRSHSLRRTDRSLLLIALVPVAWTIVYFILPLPGLLIAFLDFNPRLGILKSPWVGLHNFEFFFYSSDSAWRLTRNTIGLNALFLVFKMIGGVSLAIILYRMNNRHALRVYQTALFLPFFISWVAVAYIAYAFLSPGYGLINGWLRLFGVSAINWYADPAAWPAILTFVNTWKWLGYHTILFYAALVALDPTLEEAASTDGASQWNIIRSVYLPHMTTVFWALTLINLGNIFYADIGLFWNVPRNIGMLFPTTQVLDTYVYNSFRLTGNIGMASAAGLYQSIVGLVVIVAVNHLIRRKNPASAIF
jgi:putative aldouronate transport system permease protein